MEALKQIFNRDIGLLIFRLIFGGTMFLSHGFAKFWHFSEMADKFPDPFGFGSTISLGLTVFAEALCSLLVAMGLFTRLALMPLLVTMFVAVFVIHWDDPFGSKEKAFLYLMAFLGIFMAGPGRISLDEAFKKKEPYRLPLS